ncbi:MAG: hypothetical protein GEU97_23700 [Actinophytocola sp.]|nr:hypothetical protein [Actinophytocola sp.]
MSARVVIVGAGYAGVSAAKRLARGRSGVTPDVTIVNPRADFVERIRLHQYLAGNRAATLPLSSVLPRSTTFVPGSAETIDVAPNGALLVDETLVSVGASTVVGAGDASRIEPAPIRMSCQAAVPLGAHAAETVLHLIAGTTPKPVRPKFVGQCISLGRKAGMMQRTTSDDVPTSFRITGKPGALLKEQICTSTVKYGLNPDRAWMSYSWS